LYIQQKFTQPLTICFISICKCIKIYYFLLHSHGSIELNGTSLGVVNSLNGLLNYNFATNKIMDLHLPLVQVLEDKGEWWMCVTTNVFLWLRLESVLLFPPSLQAPWFEVHLIHKLHTCTSIPRDIKSAL